MHVSMTRQMLHLGFNPAITYSKTGKHLAGDCQEFTFRKGMIFPRHIMTIIKSSMEKISSCTAVLKSGGVV